MSESTDAILRRAHEFIENEQLEQAQETLAPLLESESNNPALWWVYAHAVSESAIGAAALERVLQLDPTYPGARELKADVDAALGGLVSDLDSELELASAQSSDVNENNIDDWESIKPAVEDTTSNQRAGRGFVMIIVALLILASGAVLILSGAIDLDEILPQVSEPTQQPIIVVVEPMPEASATDSPITPEATNIATATLPALSPTAANESARDSSISSDATDIATVDPITETEAIPEPATTQALPDIESFVALIIEQITEFAIDPSRSVARETELGMTLDVLICATPGEEFNVRLNAVMDAAAELLDSLPAEVEAFAVSLVNCDIADASARTIGVARSILTDFAAGEIAGDAFQQAWRILA